MHARYETLCDGKLPKGCRKRTTWDKLKALKNACHKVMVAKKEHFFLECSANPNGLTCRGCKTFSHDGMCPHVMAVTHVMEQLKDEGDRDSSLDLHRLVGPLDRVGGEGGLGQAEAEVKRRRRKRWNRSTRKGGDSKSKAAKGTGVVVAKNKASRRQKQRARVKEVIGTPSPGGRGGRIQGPPMTPPTAPAPTKANPYQPPPGKQEGACTGMVSESKQGGGRAKEKQRMNGCGGRPASKGTTAIQQPKRKRFRFGAIHKHEKGRTELDAIGDDMFALLTQWQEESTGLVDDWETLETCPALVPH